jgi:hypothetical protein
MRWKGFLFLIIAWMVAILLNVWVASLPNSLDYWLPVSTFLLLVIGATISYPLLLTYQHFQKKIKGGSKGRLLPVKIDKFSLLMALIISITITFLLLSTYSHTEGDVTRNGILPMIENLFDTSGNWVAFTALYLSIILFFIELVVSYFVVSILRMWKTSKK